MASATDSTVRYLGIEVDDALEMAEQTGEEIPRAPRWSEEVVLSYETDVAHGWRLTLDGSVDCESGQTHRRDPHVVPRADSVTKYGVALAWNTTQVWYSPRRTQPHG